MIVPITPYAIRGAVWYQGEANQLSPSNYKEMMDDMIKNWREDWGQGDFPFYYVQIAPYNYNNGVNSALLREAQLSAMEITNTGMAVTMDIGNPKDIHPKNKKDVGYRLALWALAKDYGFTDIIFSGPVYKAMKIDGNKIILSFHYHQGLKTVDKKALTNFEIAGDDKKFYPAKAEIKNNNVVVYNDNVEKPVAVRYGWSDTAKPNLCNKANLPASSFRTDNWE
jgi:sialate O-acetylesterase